MFTDWEDGPDPTQITSVPSYPAVPTEYNPPTRTVTLNMTQQSIIADYSEYCPLTEDDYDDGYMGADLSEACEDLFDKYCEPDPDKRKPSSTSFLASCFPWRTSATPTSLTKTGPSGTRTAKPSPTMDGTNPKCTKYHKVESGDSCPYLADQYGVSLDDV